MPRYGMARAAGRLNGRNVDGLGAFVAGLGVEGDLRALGERVVAVTDDAGVVDEEVLAGLVGSDEPEPLLVAEPLHGSACHCCPPGLVPATRTAGKQPSSAKHCFASPHRTRPAVEPSSRHPRPRIRPLNYMYRPKLRSRRKRSSARRSFTA